MMWSNTERGVGGGSTGSETLTAGSDVLGDLSVLSSTIMQMRARAISHKLYPVIKPVYSQKLRAHQAHRGGR